MKWTLGAILACFVFAVVISAEPAAAAEADKDLTKAASISKGATALGQPPNVPPTTKPVKPPPGPKPPRSIKNPNDGDDGNSDGNAGGGNDDKDTGGDTTGSEAKQE